MDPMTLIGILIAFGAMVAMVLLEGASITSLLLPAPMILVFGGTIAIAIGSGTIRDALRATRALPRAFLARIPSPAVVIDEMVATAERARRDGLLALEQQAEESSDSVMTTGLQNIADGTDAAELRTLLEDTADTRIAERRGAAKFFMVMGGYAPTVGIIGTVVSLTHVLENLSEPDELGHMIAAAFVATLWGLVSANFMWLPIGGKLGRLADLEEEQLALMVEGLLAIQAGTQPRALRERLSAMVPAGRAPRAESDAPARASATVPIPGAAPA